MIHQTPSPLAGKTVQLTRQINGLVGTTFIVEDYFDRVKSLPWKAVPNDPVSMLFGMRTKNQDALQDNEVLYGKIDGMPHAVHVSEIDPTSITS